MKKADEKKAVKVEAGKGTTVKFLTVEEELRAMVKDASGAFRFQSELVTRVQGDTLRTNSGIYGRLHIGTCASRGIIVGTEVTGIQVISFGEDKKTHLPVKNTTLYISEVAGNIDVAYDLEDEDRESIG